MSANKNGIKRAGRLILAVVALCMPVWANPPAGVPATQPVPAEMRAGMFRRAMARTAPSVVMIETVGGLQPAGERTARGARRRPSFILAEGPTTGVIYRRDGLILSSAFNFARDPSVITVTLADGRRFVGTLLARDEIRQLALLRIEADDLPAIEWVGDDGGVRPGQWALALGRGLGGEGCSLTAGVVSAVSRMGGLAIQTDAHLSPANFGGLLIDRRGRAMGLCVPLGLGEDPLAGAAWYDSGIGFAIAGEQIEASMASLVEGISIRRGLLGVMLDVTAGQPPTITNIADPSPARRAGLAIGDVIIGFNGKPVASYPALKRNLRRTPAGRWRKIRIRREHHEFQSQIMLAVPEDIGAFTRSEPTAPPDDETPEDSEP